MSAPTLDPQARDLLDAAAAAGLPPVEELPVPEARQRLRAAFVSDAPVEPVLHVEERAIAAPGDAIGLRVYRPKAGTLPLIMFFHGGGWALNDLDTHDRVCRRISNACGAVVVSVGYRRSPEYRYPTQVEDCYLATVWAVADAMALDIDPAHVAVVGDSSGGTCAAAVALLARDRGFPALEMQGLIYPVTDAPSDASPSYSERGTGYALTKSHMQWFWEMYVGSDGNVDLADPYLCPLRARDLSNLPGGFVVTAEFDPLRDEGRRYAERVQDAGTDITYRNVPDLRHIFVLQTDEVARAQDELHWICGQIGSHLHDDRR